MKLGLFIGLSTLDIIGYVENAPTADQKVDALDVWVGAGGPTTNAAVTFRRLGGEARLIAAWGPGSVSSLALHDLSSEDVETTDVYASGDLPTSLVTWLWRAQARSPKAKIASLLHPPHARVRWFSTYFRMMSPAAAAQDAAKYEGDQRWSR